MNGPLLNACKMLEIDPRYSILMKGSIGETVIKSSCQELESRFTINDPFLLTAQHFDSNNSTVHGDCESLV